MNRLRLSACLLAVVFAAGCSRHPRLTVVNASGVPLDDVVAVGAGFSTVVGSIPPGQRRQVELHPAGESSLALEFDAAGRHHAPAAQGYFEASGHYRLEATVAPDFSFKLDVQLH